MWENHSGTHSTWEVWLYPLSAFKADFLYANDAPAGYVLSICVCDGNPKHNPGPLQSHQISKDNSEN